MKSLISKCLRPIVAVAAVGCALPVFAGSGMNSGGIENTFVASTTFFTQSPGDYLITIAGLDTLCPGHGFAYLLTTDSNYTTLTNFLSVARQNGEHIYVYWTTDAKGYCHITNATAT
jgi:hypothetical protein